MSLFYFVARRIVHTTLLLSLVAFGTICLTRFAPGYFSDAREMDSKYGSRERSALVAEEAHQGSFGALAVSTVRGWTRGDFGQSREYGVPVGELVRPRLGVTGRLLLRGIAGGWLMAFLTALPLSLAQRGRTLLGLPFTLLIAVPTGAMATLCIVRHAGGPLLVLTLLLAARDFKFLARLFRSAWAAPHLLHARGRGLPVWRLALTHMLSPVIPQILALATVSIVTALSAIVPLEVIFDVPGVGQLAWNAAMNRDLPVLMLVTLLMALLVSLAGAISPRVPVVQTA